MTQAPVKPLPVDPDVLARIRPMGRQDVDDVVRLHHAAMGNSLWAQLGPRFLRAVYSGLVAHPDFRAYVYVEDGRPKGFIAGSHDSQRMFRQVARSNLLGLGISAVYGLVQEPRLLWRFAQSARYFSSAGQTGVDQIRAESMFCSFEPALRGRRISGLINKVLFDELAALGHQYVKISTDADNPLSARQLTSWGFERMGPFRFYGKEMLAWRLDLTTSSRVEPVDRFGTATYGGSHS